MRKTAIVDQAPTGRKSVEEDPEDALVPCPRCGAEAFRPGPACAWCVRLSDEALRRLLADEAFAAVEAWYEERAEER